MEKGRRSLLESFPFCPPEKFKNLPGKEIFNRYFSTILATENMLFGDRNTRIHKLVFLAAPKNDVTLEVDEKGRSIYLKNPPLPKVPEIFEASAALSKYFVSVLDPKPNQSLIGENRVDAMSELADIFHNVAELIQLDPVYAEKYVYCINQLAQALSTTNAPFTINDGMTLAYVKYRERLVNIQEKSIEDENFVIRRAMNQNSNGNSLISVPTDEGFKKAFRLINGKIHKTLSDRLGFVRNHSNSDNGN